MREKFLSAMLGLSMIASMAVPTMNAFAADAVNENQNFTESKPDASCEVILNGKDSNFSVTVPKNIVGTGKSGTLSYNVTIDGDIAGNEHVTVVPDASVTLKQNKKADVVANVAQDRTEWAADEFSTNGNGTITYNGLSAGAWSGAFNFNIGLTKNEDAVTLKAGLYDADGVMLCSWEDSGIDVEQDYNASTYKTATTSSYNVLTNKYPTTTKVVIPEGIAKIGNFTFSRCTNLTDINIPDSVTSIGNTAFSSCTGLTDINIPDSVTSIGNFAFSSCTGLTDINIPDSITSISYGAFNGCTGLTDINIPNSVKNIDNNAFAGCTNLTDINIPNSITEIGEGAFEGCTNLTDINIPEGVTVIKYKIFNGCTSLTSITIPNSVKNINGNAFEGCTNLTDINIPEGVTFIGISAFNGCTSLTNINIPNSVTSIKNNAFYKVPHITYNGTSPGAPWGALSMN